MPQRLAHNMLVLSCSSGNGIVGDSTLNADVLCLLGGLADVESMLSARRYLVLMMCIGKLIVTKT